MNYIKYYLYESWACGHIRGEVMAREFNRLYNDMRIDIKMDIFASDMINTSLAVFLRQNSQAFLDRMKVFQKRGIKCAYDIDDDVFSIPPECAELHRLFKDPTARDRFLEFVKTADALLVSTPYLADSLRKHTQVPMFVIPNSLDVSSWDSAFHTRMTGLLSRPAITLGWTGSSFHMYDAPVVGEALGMIMEEFPSVRLTCIGWPKIEHFNNPGLTKFADRIKIGDWVPIDVLPEAMAEFDIGLAPLNHGYDYNRSRSGIKWMQYAALGIPTVASPMEPYQDVMKEGETGLFASNNSPKGWYEAIKKLVMDSVLRDQLGLAARREVLLKHDMRNNVAVWHDAFRSLMRG